MSKAASPTRVCRLCPEPAATRKSLCIGHIRETARDREAEKRRIRTEQGLCVGCGGQRDGKATICARCYSIRKQSYGRRKAKAVAGGICVSCPQPAVPGKKTCEKHGVGRRTYHAERNKALREKGVCRRCLMPSGAATQCENCREKTIALRAQRHEAGLCIKCGKGNDRPHRTCTECAERRKSEHQQRGYLSTHKNRRQKGLCRRCGRSTPGRLVCEPCGEAEREEAKRWRDELRRAGLCRECRSPREPGKSLCPTCGAARRSAFIERREQRRAAGLCVYCNQPFITQSGQPRCLDHWLYQFVYGCKQRDCGEVEVDTKELRELWDRQEGKCAYTGVALLPGVNASLDHRLPVSRGGKSNKENLQWVDYKINVMKNDRTHEEFIAICAMIVRGSSA